MKKILSFPACCLFAILCFFSQFAFALDTLQVGSKGNQVVWLQRSLISCGFSIGGCGCDGIFGAGTKTAVKAFQSANGLGSDGVVGINTWNAIRNKIRGIQNALISKGYSVGNSGADGLYGDDTMNAVRRFQSASGLATDGLAGNNTQRALFNSSSIPISAPTSMLPTTPSGDVKTYSLARDGERNLSEHFKVKEFRCKDGSDIILISDKLVNVLENIRNHFGRSLIITSGYRTVSYNSRIGGVANSQHTKGTAADIQVPGVSPSAVANYADSLGVGGLGRYSSFTHIDVRAGHARWRG